MEHVPFVHLHLHTEYSLLDGMCRIPELVERAHALHMPALAMTDHGNLFGAVQFYRECQRGGVKPVLGCELYVAVGDMRDRPKGAKRKYHHLIVLAKNDRGWRNLMRLVTDAYLEGFYYKPRVDKDALRRHGDGLIALTSCLSGEVPRAITEGRLEDAAAAAAEYKAIFGDGNFYLELQDHGVPRQQAVNAKLAEIGAQHGIPLVATNDVHYVAREHAAAHDVLITLQQNTTLDDPRRWRYESDELHLKSFDEMRERFADWPEALDNTIAIANACNVEFNFDEVHLPKFHPPAGQTDAEYLRALCERGLEWRYGARNVPEATRERLEHELTIINRMGYASYFLVVHDFVREARERGVPVGPGRGSAAGSIVSFLLGITGLDPQRFGLLFERFLNPDRVSMPDIDIDFCYERRGEIIDYVTQKYGKDCVSQIITFGQLRARAVIRDVGRVMGMEFGAVDKLAKLVPAELNIRLADAVEKEPELKRLQVEDPTVRQLLEYAFQLEGLPRHASTHAAGVVICEEPLTQYVPLYRHAGSGDVTSQYPMGDLEQLGLLKMDFLGLRTLTVMSHAIESIRERLGQEIDLAHIPLDDAKTYDMLNRAECIGVFQMESSGMRDLARKIGLTRFEDIIAIVALFRPGPMNMLDDFVSRKHGHTTVVYDHPKLEPILKETHGIMLYQEQVMQIAVELAGFTLAESDTLRKAMGKKLPEVMATYADRFVEGAEAGGCGEEKARKIWNDILQFAGYGFNKSHSAAYGLIAYQTAWLKANYPTDFLAALLTSEMGNTDKVVQYIAEAQRMDITVAPPDVNQSFDRFRVTDERTIRFGLAAVKNVGAGAIAAIVAEREANGPYTSIYDFCRRVDLRQVNRRVIESLVKAGAMDGFGRPRRHMFSVVEAAIQAGHIAQRDRQAGQTSLLDMLTGAELDRQVAAEEVYPDGEAEWTEHEVLQYEKEVLGLYVTGHPLGQYAQTLERYCSATALTVKEMTGELHVTVGGLVRSVKPHIIGGGSRKGEKMAFVELEDLHGTLEVTVFSDLYAQTADLLQPDCMVVIQGRAEVRDEEIKLVAERIVPIDEVEAEMTRAVHLSLITAGLERETVDRVYDVIRQYPGECRLFLHVESGNSVAHVETPPGLRVAPTPVLREALARLIGPESVWLTGQRKPILAGRAPQRRRTVAGAR